MFSSKTNRTVRIDSKERVHVGRRCVSCGLNYIGMEVFLRETDGSKTCRCFNCVFDLVKFYPNEVRIAKRIPQNCEFCGIIDKVILIKIAYLPEEAKAWHPKSIHKLTKICCNCFKKPNNELVRISEDVQ